MNEQRLVTLILIVLLVLGAAGLVAVYFATSDRVQTAPGSTSREQTKTGLPVTTVKQVSPLPVRVSRDAVNVPADQSEKETAIASRSKNIAPGPSPTELTGTESPLPPESSQITIHETTKSNGSFVTAQEITEGIITGKRGAAGDRSDFYKIRATGKTMILRLEPALKKKNQRFAMTVFDVNKKPVGQDSKKTGPAITLAVTPESTYYIKLDLRHAPVKKPQYKLNVKFE